MYFYCYVDMVLCKHGVIVFFVGTHFGKLIRIHERSLNSLLI